MPVTYGYISDVHDAHAADPTTDSYVSTATGPGEAAHDAQLKDYDDAFEAFFRTSPPTGSTRATRSSRSPSTRATTSPAAPASPSRTAASRTRTRLRDAHGLPVQPDRRGQREPAGPAACRRAGVQRPQRRRADGLRERPPGPTDPTVRQLERDVAGLQAPDPYAEGGQSVPLTVNMADPVEEQALHMVNADPNRTPTFTLFGNDDFFFTTSDPSFGTPNQCAGVHLCAVPSFAWNHGDVQEEIGNTWAGLVGPGVAHHGIDSQTWTDHTNLRPTILALTGLKDDYAHDGRVLSRRCSRSAIPAALRSPLDTGLAEVYEQLNAPFGQFGQDTLGRLDARVASGSATDDSQYTRTEAQIQSLTAKRDALAQQISAQLDAAAFAHQPIPPFQAIFENAHARLLIAAAHALARGAA